MSALVARKAPDFEASAVLGNGEIVTHFRLSEYLNGHYGLLFFYPLDFTFVCPSELIALNNRFEKFEKKGVKIVGISIDSQFTHHAWRETPLERGGIGPVQYPLVADVTHAICQSYGVEHPNGVALRAAFLIDHDFTVRSMVVNDLPLGRDIDELLRLVDALIFHKKHGEVCPANWRAGKAGMKASTQGVADYLSQNAMDLKDSERE